MPKLETQIEFSVGIFSHERVKHLNFTHLSVVRRRCAVGVLCHHRAESCSLVRPLSRPCLPRRRGPWSVWLHAPSWYVCPRGAERYKRRQAAIRQQYGSQPDRDGRSAKSEGESRSGSHAPQVVSNLRRALQAEVRAMRAGYHPVSK